MDSSLYIQIVSLRISFQSVRKLGKYITLLFDGVMDIERTYVIMSDIALVEFIECRYEIPAEFLELSNIPLTVIFSSVSNDIWKVCIEVFKNEEVSEGQLLLKTTVDTKRILHLDKIGTLSGIENFVDMFLIKDVFIELTLHLFKFSLSESDGFVMIPASIKSLVEVKGVEKDIVDFDVECLFIDC